MSLFLKLRQKSTYDHWELFKTETNTQGLLTHLNKRFGV